MRLTVWLENITFDFLLLAMLVVVVARLCVWWRLRREPMVELELTPGFDADGAPGELTQLLRNIHAEGLGRSLMQRLLYHRQRYVLEVVSSRPLGIVYRVQVPASERAHFERSLGAALPDVAVRQLTKPLDLDYRFSRITSFRQTRHFMHPLDAEGSVSGVYGALTDVRPGEMMTLQLVIVPVSSRAARRMHDVLVRGGVLRQHPYRWLARLGVLSLIFGTISAAGIEVLWFVMKHSGRRLRRLSGGSSTEQAAMDVARLRAKLGAPLMRTDLRLIATSPNPLRRIERTREFTTTLLSRYGHNQQRFQLQRQVLGKLLARYRAWSARTGMPRLIEQTSNLLSIDEVAGLYDLSQTSGLVDNLQVAPTRSLAAPISLKNDAPLEVVLGVNRHHGVTTEIGLTAVDRSRHTLVVGGTGNGKTTLMTSGIVADINAGRGVTVIDPHGDLAVSLLGRIPESRVNDVIYLNPDDLARPIGLNLLEVDASLTGDELMREQDFIAESIVSVFRKVFSGDGAGGHRIEYVLRNAIHTAFTVPGATLFTIYDLLEDAAFRRSVVAKLTDHDLKLFWTKEFARAGSYQQTAMAAGITAKIGRFARSASARRMLEQPVSTINFDDIVANGKIVLCNFSKGLLGEDTSQLLGVTVLAKLQLATYRRARLTEDCRRPHYLYVDEFQDFATPSFVQLLSEARKYRLVLMLAAQSTAQLPDAQMSDVIFANVGTIICFRTGSPKDEQRLLPLFTPYVRSGEMARLPSYHFYIRIASSVTQPPLSGETVTLPDVKDQQRVERVIQASRRTYARALESLRPDDVAMLHALSSLRVEDTPDSDERRPEYVASRGTK